MRNKRELSPKWEKRIDHLKYELKNNGLVFLWWLIYSALVVGVPCYLITRSFGFGEMRTHFKIMIGGAVVIVVLIVYTSRQINEYIMRIKNAMIRTVLKTVKALVPLVLTYYILNALSGSLVDVQKIVLWAIWLNLIASVPLGIVETNLKKSEAEDFAYEQDMIELEREEREQRKEKREKKKQAKREIAKDIEE